MVMSSLQICMDSSNWQEGLMQMDRCLKPQDHQNHMISAFGQRSSVKIIPQQQQQQQQQQQRQQENQQNNNQEALKCPRCDSTNTKFCYYNNYSLSQPRHFCKTCRRYWTRGGALRNVPVGGGCRKNKRNKRTLTAFDIRAASVIASSNPSSLSISLPTTSAIASDLLPGPFSQTQNHTNNSSILYGLPNTSNELNMAFTRINQLNLKNNPDYGLCLNINPDTQLPGLEFCSSRPTTGEELCPFGTSLSFLEGIDTPSVNETCISWNNSGSLNEAQKISLPHLQNQALGQFGEEEHKPKIKVDDGCRNMSQMVPVSSVADTNVFQSPADEGAHGNDQYWNIGEGGWPDLSSYGSVSSSLA